MRKPVAWLFVSVALLIATAPATASYGHLAPSQSIKAYSAYYDGHYGPFHNGYWTETSEYYYSTGDGRPYARDDGHHFRKMMVSGYHPVEGFGPAPPKRTGARLDPHKKVIEAQIL